MPQNEMSIEVRLERIEQLLYIMIDQNAQLLRDLRSEDDPPRRRSSSSHGRISSRDLGEDLVVYDASEVNVSSQPERTNTVLEALYRAASRGSSAPLELLDNENENENTTNEGE